MLLYCLKDSKNTESKNPRVENTKKWKCNAFMKLHGMR